MSKQVSQSHLAKIAKLQKEIQLKNNQLSKKNVVKKVNMQNINSNISPFYRALSCPFDPEILGCQVPDPFPFPTCVFHTHQTTVIGCDATYTDGAVMLLPNPVLSMIDLTQAVNFNTLTRKAVTSTPFNRLATYGTVKPACAAYGSVNQTAVQNVFSEFRVVSWGVKISNLQPELSATGRIIVSYVPIGDTVPTENDITVASNGATSASVFTPICGMNVQTLASSSMLELPTAAEFTVGDLLHGDLELSGMYANSEFWSFKTTLGIGSAQSSYGMGDSLSTVLLSGATVTSGYKDFTRCKGGAAIVIYFEGFPAGTLNGLQLETIYHLEGNPNLTTTNNSALVASTGRRAVVGTSLGVEQAMTKASSIDKAIKFISQGASFLNRNKDPILKAGKMAMAYL